MFLTSREVQFQLGEQIPPPSSGGSKQTLCGAGPSVAWVWLLLPSGQVGHAGYGRWNGQKPRPACKAVLPQAGPAVSGPPPMSELPGNKVCNVLTVSWSVALTVWWSGRQRGAQVLPRELLQGGASCTPPPPAPWLLRLGEAASAVPSSREELVPGPNDTGGRPGRRRGQDSPQEPRSRRQSQALESSQWPGWGGTTADLWARAQQQRREEPQYLLEARAAAPGVVRLRERGTEQKWA